MYMYVFSGLIGTNEVRDSVVYRSLFTIQWYLYNVAEEKSCTSFVLDFARVCLSVCLSLCPSARSLSKRIPSSISKRIGRSSKPLLTFSPATTLGRIVVYTVNPRHVDKSPLLTRVTHTLKLFFFFFLCDQNSFLYRYDPCIIAVDKPYSYRNTVRRIVSLRQSVRHWSWVDATSYVNFLCT